MGTYLRQYARPRALCGGTGQPPRDPVVFFKQMLVGHLENMVSDRCLIEHCALRLGILAAVARDGLFLNDNHCHVTDMQNPELNFVLRIRSATVFIGCLMLRTKLPAYLKTAFSEAAKASS